jgi:hypothetical protein
MQARLARQEGDQEAAHASAGQAHDLFARLGDTRGPDALRRMAAPVQSRC